MSAHSAIAVFALSLDAVLFSIDGLVSHDRSATVVGVACMAATAALWELRAIRAALEKGGAR